MSLKTIVLAFSKVVKISFLRNATGLKKRRLERKRYQVKCDCRQECRVEPDLAVAGVRLEDGREADQGEGQEEWLVPEPEN